MPVPSPEVRAELAALIEADQSRLGDVYRMTARGLTPPQIAQELGVDSSGFVSNNRSIAKALVEGTMPSGPSVAKQVASSVRGLMRKARVSTQARSYVDDLLAALEEAAGGKPRWTTQRGPASGAAPQPAPTSEGSLREQVELQLRSKAATLVATIRVEVNLDADDYYRVASATSALDALVRLVQVQATSRTTRDLHRAGRLELSLESAVVQWASDLPLTADLVEAARGRLEYWRST